MVNNVSIGTFWLHILSCRNSTRDISKNIGTTFIREEFDNILKQNNAYQISKILDGSSEVHIINVEIAYNLLKKNLENNGNYIFFAKINE